MRTLTNSTLKRRRAAWRYCRAIVTGVTCTLLLMAAPVDGRAQGYQVVVNSANPVTTLGTEQLAEIFQKKSTEWPNGQAAVPVDLPADAPARQAFSEAVHGRPAAAIKAYWQRLIFSGRGVPPMEKASDEEVLAYVAANPNAVGYVSSGVRLNGNVKALLVTTGG